VKWLNIRHIDRDSVTGAYQFPDQTYLTPLRAALAAQSGIPVETILKEQENRLREPTIRRIPQPTHDGRERQTTAAGQPVTQPESGNGNAAPPQQPPKRIQRRHRIGKG
jgi:hypothetical protein